MDPKDPKAGKPPAPTTASPPGKPGKPGGKPVIEGEDWFSAVDEWEKNFDFTPSPTGGETTSPGGAPGGSTRPGFPPPADATPSPDRSAAPEPESPPEPQFEPSGLQPPVEVTNPGVALEMESAILPLEGTPLPMPLPDEPAALDAVPGAPSELHEEDPFFKLFEPGDMEVSEEVAPLGEPLGADLPIAPGASDAPGVPAEAAAAAGATVEFTADEAGDDELEISISPAAPAPAPRDKPAAPADLGTDLADSYEDSTRVVSGYEVSRLLSSDEAKAPAPAPVTSAPPPALADEDFYDDISIETSAKEPEPPPVAAPAPTRPAAPARKASVDAPTTAFRLDDEARLRARLSDPDSTPLPVGEDVVAAESAAPASAGREAAVGSTSDRGSGRFTVPAPTKRGDAASVLQSLAVLENSDIKDESTSVLSMPSIANEALFDDGAAERKARPESRKLEESRLPLPDPRTILDEVKDLPAPPAADPNELLRRQSLLDTERLLASESNVIAQLALASGRLAERTNDYSLAAEHYETVVASEPSWVIGYEALRRARLRLGQTEAAIATLERAAPLAAPGEKPLLAEQRAELLAAMGEEGAALAAIEQARKAEHASTWALGTLALELAARRHEKGPLQQALASLAAEANATGEKRLAAALSTLLGRLAEEQGDASGAERHFRTALELDSTLERAALGLLRVALRSPSVDDDVEAWQRVLELVQAGPARIALLRRLAQDREARNRPEEAGLIRALYERAAAQTDGGAAGDRLALWSLAMCDEQRGDHERAIGSYSRLADSEPDAARAADLWVTVGDLEQRRGGTAAAVAAYRRATELRPGEVRAARGLEQALSAGGDKQAALDRELALAERDPVLRRAAWVRAARLEHELGKTADALVHLGQILDEEPAYLPALDRYVEIAATDAATPEVWRNLTLRLAAAASHTSDAAIGGALLLRAIGAACRSGDAGLVEEQLSGVGDRELGLEPSEWQRLFALYVPTLLPGALHRLQGELEMRDEKRAADLGYARIVLSQLLGGDVASAIGELGKVLALDATYRPAAMLQRLLLQQSGRAAEIPTALQPLVDAASGSVEKLALRLRQTLLCERDAQDPTAALALLSSDPAVLGQPGSAEWAAELGRALGSRLERARLLESWRAAASTTSRRVALGLTVAGLYEDADQHERALETYRQLESEGGEWVEVALDRLLRRSGGAATLGERALARLREATTDEARLAAYHKLAFLDERLRGDQESAELAYTSMVEIDPTHPIAFRTVERRALREGDQASLAALYRRAAERTTDVVAGAAWAADAARLYAQASKDSDETVSAWELAVERDPSSRPALRQLIRVARQGGRPRLERRRSELYTRLGAASATDPRSVAVCLTRAAEIELEAGRAEEATRLFSAAHKERPEHLPALLQGWALALANEHLPEALELAERVAQHSVAPALRAELALLAGTLARTLPGEPLERAVADLKLAFDLQPHNLEAFERLHKALEHQGDHALLAAVVRRRLEVETDARRKLHLHLVAGALQRDHLGDRAVAKEEFAAALQLEPANREALRQAADLAWEDARWPEAAELFIREARVETDNKRLHVVFVRLGEIYRLHVPDPKRAIASYLRACKIDGTDLASLGHLSDLFLAEWEWKGALQATMRLAELEQDQVKKIDHLFRIAKIHEEGFSDARKALETLRRAHELDVMYLPAIGELAKYFDRTSDVQSMRVHLDRAALRYRQQAASKPYDADAYRALLKIFQWRRAPDRAFLAAGVLDYLGAVGKDETQILERGAQSGYPGPSFAEPAIDELLFDARLPPGLRMLLRRLDEVLGKAYRADVRRFNLAKNDRLPRSGHPVRDLANRIALDLGIRDFELYVTAVQPRALVVELGDPMHLVLGSLLCDTTNEAELRFVLGRALKLAHCRVLPLIRMSADEAAVFVGGLVRQFVPDFVPRGVDEKAVVAEAQKLGKIVPKKLHQELAPFAFECASSELDFTKIPSALLDAGNRAGLLAAGQAGAALRAIARLDDAAQLRGLLAFLMSDEAAELRRVAGTQVS